MLKGIALASPLTTRFY